MKQLTSLSISEQRKGLLSKEFSAVELSKAHLSRIEETNGELNSFISITNDFALKAAENADKVIQAQGEKSPLMTGIPVAIKDMLVTKGLETTCASKILKGFVPPYDGTAVKQLKDSGAVIVGKANLDEFAMGSSNENSAFGPAKNPWDTSRVPGGSSGGSAVSVASGQAAAALGTDTGGSIRQPASFCGVYGLKPTYGRVSRYGAVAFASSLDQIGPFARSVEDLATVLEVISGYDEKDSTSLKTEVPSYSAALKSSSDKGMKGLKVGVPKEYMVDGIQPEVKEAFDNSLKEMEKLGAEIVEISLPHTEYALAVYYVVAPAEASSNLSRYDGVRYGHRTSEAKNLSESYAKSRGEGFGEEVRRRILIGTYVLSAGYYDAYYKKAQQVRTLIIEDFKAAFQNQCDVIATPVSPTTAFEIGAKTASPLEMYIADIFTIPTSLAGLPGLSAPCGLDKNGLPIGLQLIAPVFEEARLLQVANTFSKQINFPTTQCIR